MEIVGADARLKLHLADKRKNNNGLDVGFKEAGHVGEMLGKKLHEIVLHDKVIICEQTSVYISVAVDGLRLVTLHGDYLAA